MYLYQVSMEKIAHLVEWITSLGGYANTKTKRFLRYTFSGTSTFVLDFLLLWFLNGALNIHYIPAATVSYILATVVHYYIVRNWAFTGTKRQIIVGYIYFSIIAGAGLGLNILLLAFFVEIVSVHTLLARLISGIFVGIWNYILNLFLNFKTHGQQL